MTKSGIIGYVKQKNNIYFEFFSVKSNKIYSLVYSTVKKTISCDCFNGSNMGVNGVQQCHHKKAVLEFIEKLKNKKY